MQSKQLFEWFLQQQGETQEGIAGIMDRANQVIDLHRADSSSDELSDAELSETFFSETILYFVRRDVNVTFLPAGASPQYALKVWAQNNNICSEMPDAVREALSPDEQLARETAEIVAFLVEGGATEVIITTKMTLDGRIVAIMAVQPEDEEIDPLALLGGEQFDESLHDISEWTDEEFDEWVAEFKEEDLEDIDPDAIDYFLKLYPDDED